MVLLVAAILSLPFLAVLALRPVERRLALRHPVRRPVEALLVIAGSMLGTAIITGSLVVGDTVERSIRASAYDQLGPIDELVSVSGLDAGDDLAQRFSDFSHPDVDGTLTFATAPAAVSATGPDAPGQPRAQVLEVDVETAARFGGDPTITGLSGPALEPGRAAVTVDLARRVDAEAGDRLDVFAFGRSATVVVDRVVDRSGVAGFWPIDRRQQAYNVIVAPGFLDDLTEGLAFDEATGTEPPTAHLAVSNRGGVEAGARHTAEVTAAIQAHLGDLAARVQPVKQDLLDDAVASAESLTELYFTLGMFAVAAGVLLLVNVFVMLADDRRSELGMLRAIGLRRLPLVAAFATEGWMYSVIASGIGAVAGIGVGRVIAWRADQILTAGDEVFALSLSFSFEWSTVLTGLGTGLLISLATVVATSARVSRLNVIAAIRDLPTTPRGRRRRLAGRLGAGAALLGGAWTATAFAATDPYGIIVGPMLVIPGVAAILARRLPTRAVVNTACAAVLVWGVAFLGVLAALDIDIEIAMFLIQGLAMSGAAVVVLTSSQTRLAHLAGRLSGGSLPVRIGLAYPVARRFRTGMTLGMFSIVILTLVYLSVLSLMFRNQVDEITEDASGGFGIVVTANPTDPVPPDELAEISGVARVAPLAYGVAEFVVEGYDRDRWPVTGFDAELIRGGPPALADPGRFDSAEEAWRAVLGDPDLVIVDDFFLSDEAGPPSAAVGLGDTVTVTDPASGRTRDLTVAAIAEGDVLNSGPYYGIDGYREVFGARAVPSRYYVGAGDPDAVVATIRRELLDHGADAETVRVRVETMLAQNTGFFTLMQQFVGVGLMVGIAGIGVLMVRAVRERRREIGMLRALGVKPRGVAAAFLVEAGFVAVEGITIGVLVALVGSYGLVRSGAGFTEGLDWAVPVGEVAVIAAVALAASALAALIPARRASAIQPAAALRITD